MVVLLAVSIVGRKQLIVFITVHAIQDVLLVVKTVTRLSANVETINQTRTSWHANNTIEKSILLA